MFQSSHSCLLPAKNRKRSGKLLALSCSIFSRIPEVALGGSFFSLYKGDREISKVYIYIFGSCPRRISSSKESRE